MSATTVPNSTTSSLPEGLPDPGLIRFNLEVLEQALDIAQAFCAEDQRNFSSIVGPHLRHVVEHYDALLIPACKGLVDYDQRPRDAHLEADPRVAVMRLEILRKRINRLSALELAEVIEVRGQGGVRGDLVFAVHSTLERELVFVAMHAIHHYAMVSEACLAGGLVLPTGFGHAPATVAHARSFASSRSSSSLITS
jgi:hypothetical protein